MRRHWKRAEYETKVLENDEEGWIGIDLMRTENQTAVRVARITFWDADGGFALSIFAEELPLEIVEDLISDAKALVER